MILVTGGLGFIGTHTVRAVMDLRESCVVTQHRMARVPDFIKDDIGKRVFIESLDVADQSAFHTIGKRYKIAGIVHLAAPGLGPLFAASELGTLFEGLRVNIEALLNVLHAAVDWQTVRATIASSMGVYGGVLADDSFLRPGHRSPSDE